jgi:hypothetical protein
VFTPAVNVDAGFEANVRAFVVSENGLTVIAQKYRPRAVRGTVLQFLWIGDILGALEAVFGIVRRTAGVKRGTRFHPGSVGF